MERAYLPLRENKIKGNDLKALIAGETVKEDLIEIGLRGLGKRVLVIYQKQFFREIGQTFPLGRTDIEMTGNIVFVPGFLEEKIIDKNGRISYSVETVPYQFHDELRNILRCLDYQNEIRFWPCREEA